jgi:hypothetical protein
MQQQQDLHATGATELQWTFHKTIWKAYKIVYNSFSDVKA